MMEMYPSVLRRGRVREHLVERDIIGRHIVARVTDDRRVRLQIADQGRQCDVHDIVPETSAVRPTARDNAAIGCLYRAYQRITTEHAEPRKPVVVRNALPAGKPRWTGGKIHLDRI